VRAGSQSDNVATLILLFCSAAQRGHAGKIEFDWRLAMGLPPQREQVEILSTGEH
jgi:hypothetical protein